MSKVYISVKGGCIQENFNELIPLKFSPPLPSERPEFDPPFMST
jgi:hypothetical protein